MSAPQLVREEHMAIVRHIGLGSAFKVGLVVYGIVGLIAGVFCSVVAFAAGASHLPFAGRYAGVFALIVCPILYGIGGAVVAVISALVYNLASGWVGGLEVDLQ
jgi:hypothetical protein